MKPRKRICLSRLTYLWCRDETQNYLNRENCDANSIYAAKDLQRFLYTFVFFFICDFFKENLVFFATRLEDAFAIFLVVGSRLALSVVEECTVLGDRVVQTKLLAIECAYVVPDRARTVDYPLAIE